MENKRTVEEVDKDLKKMTEELSKMEAGGKDLTMILRRINKALDERLSLMK